MLSPFLETLSGYWYNESFYFRYRIHKMSFGKRLLVRFLFIPVSWAGKLLIFLRSRTEIPHVELPITIPCVAHCRECVSLYPDQLDQVDLQVDFLKKDMDDFLVHVDRVYRLTLTGGEIFLYRELPSLLCHLLSQDKIDLIHLLTNGSALPEPSLLPLLAHPKILVTVSNYPPADPPNKPRVIALLEENQVNYLVKNAWRNLGSFSPVADSSRQAARHRFSRCISKVHTLSNGEYHVCPRSAHGRQAGKLAPAESDTVAFRNRKNPQAFRKELKKLLRQDCLSACGTCEGSRKDNILTKFSRSLPGRWYHENIYFRCRVHHMTPREQDFVGLLILPIALIRGLCVSLRRRLEIPHIEMHITTRCNFRCRDCANLIPFYTQPADVDIKHLLQDAQEFLECISRVYAFIIMGGETFLYRDLHQLVSYLIGQDKIDLVRLFTNGSIIPGTDLLRLLSHPKILVTISSFPAEVSVNKHLFVAAMRKNHINYAIEYNLWRDLGGFNPDVDRSEKALKERFAACADKYCHTIMNGEYYLCPRAFHGKQLGQFVPNDSDSVIYQRGKSRQIFKKELQDLFKKDCLAACGKCRSTISDPLCPGIQMDGRAFVSAVKDGL